MWTVRITPEEVLLLWDGKTIEKIFHSGGKSYVLSLAPYDGSGADPMGLVVGLDEKSEA